MAIVRPYLSFAGVARTAGDDGDEGEGRYEDGQTWQNEEEVAVNCKIKTQHVTGMNVHPPD